MQRQHEWMNEHKRKSDVLHNFNACLPGKLHFPSTLTKAVGIETASKRLIISILREDILSKCAATKSHGSSTIVTNAEAIFVVPERTK